MRRGFAGLLSFEPIRRHMLDRFLVDAVQADTVRHDGYADPLVAGLADPSKVGDWFLWRGTTLAYLFMQPVCNLERCLTSW